MKYLILTLSILFFNCSLIAPDYDEPKTDIENGAYHYDSDDGLTKFTLNKHGENYTAQFLKYPITCGYKGDLDNAFSRCMNLLSQDKIGEWESSTPWFANLEDIKVNDNGFEYRIILDQGFEWIQFDRNEALK